MIPSFNIGGGGGGGGGGDEGDGGIGGGEGDGGDGMDGLMDVATEGTAESDSRSQSQDSAVIMNPASDNIQLSTPSIDTLPQQQNQAGLGSGLGEGLGLGLGPQFGNDSSTGPQDIISPHIIIGADNGNGNVNGSGSGNGNGNGIALQEEEQLLLKTPSMGGPATQQTLGTLLASQQTIENAHKPGSALVDRMSMSTGGGPDAGANPSSSSSSSPPPPSFFFSSSSSSSSQSQSSSIRADLEDPSMNVSSFAGGGEGGGGGSSSSYLKDRDTQGTQGNSEWNRTMVAGHTQQTPLALDQSTRLDITESHTLLGR